MTSKLRTIAFVLPQFHPIPENDKWWGKGFTEWTNVTKAKPLYKGHYQPHLPTDLGFYDLRLPEARLEQANLAKANGIHGFCYYHYWFNGKRLLHEPLDGMLNQKDLDMPFMFCWANENWTRRWDGKEDDILVQQDYNLEDDKAHMRWLCEHVFSDDRYIKVEGKPVFVIYRVNLFPDIKQTINAWQTIVREEFGWDGLYLCFTESFGERMIPSEIGFDAAIEFSPHAVIRNKLKHKKLDVILKLFRNRSNPKNIDFRDFELGVRQCIDRKIPKYKLYRGVTPSWDNTARKKDKGAIAIGSSPELYYKWLKHIVTNFKPYTEQENFVFINAMNEWAEGNHLEPCIKYGDAYLKATKKALEE